MEWASSSVRDDRGAEAAINVAANRSAARRAVSRVVVGVLGAVCVLGVVVSVPLIFGILDAAENWGPGHGWRMHAVNAFLALLHLGVFLVCSILPAWLMWRLFLWPRFARPRLLAARRCIACDYDLTGLPLESDGCTVCPECGAAWRLARKLEEPPSPSS